MGSLALVFWQYRSLMPKIDGWFLKQEDLNSDDNDIVAFSKVFLVNTSMASAPIMDTLST